MTPDRDHERKYQARRHAQPDICDHVIAGGLRSRQSK